MSLARGRAAHRFGLRGWATDWAAARRHWAPERLTVTALETTGFALFFLMLFVPAAYRPLKVVLLLPLLLATVVRTLLERRVALHPHGAFGCLLFSVLGVVFVLRGYLADAPGALRMSTVYVIWPWVNAFLLSSLADEARLWRLARLMVWTTIAICAYSVSFILWSAGWLPNALYLRLDQGQEIGFYGGFMEFGVRSMASLLFLVPFVTGALLTGSHRFRAAHLWLALASGLAIGLLSGRRAFQLILVLGLPIAVAFRLGLPVKVRRRSGPRVRRTLVSVAAVCIAAVIALQQTYGLSLGVVWTKFKTGFQFSSDAVAQSRALQFTALIDGWLNSPMLGSGHGASASVIRSVEMPWAYELSYVAFLYHTGLVGFLLYALGVTWIFVQGVRMIREGASLAPLMIAALTGMTCFLIANATNPYLEKFDCLWTLFLPLGVVNAWLLKRPAAPTPVVQ